MKSGNLVFFVQTSQFTIGEQSIPFYQQAIELVKQFYDGLDEQDPRRFYAGLMYASAYAALSETHMYTSPELQELFANQAMGYIDMDKFHGSTMFHEEVHLVFSEVFRAISEVESAMLDIEAIDKAFELAYKHALLTAPEVKLVQIHSISCFASRKYSQFIQSGINTMDLHQKFGKWLKIHEVAKVAHGTR